MNSVNDLSGAAWRSMNQSVLMLRTDPDFPEMWMLFRRDIQILVGTPDVKRRAVDTRW